MNLTQLRQNSLLNAINNNYLVISFKIDGTIKYVNDNFLLLFGYSRDEILGKQHYALCHNDISGSNEYKQFWYSLSSGNSYSGEYKRKRKNGESIYLQATYNSLINEQGQVFEILMFAQDITKKKLENIYLGSKLNAINSSQGIIEFDVNGYIKSANNIFLESMGYKLNEIINQHHSIFCENDYKYSNEYENFWSDLKAGQFKTGKYLRLGKNQKKVWIQSTYTPVFDLEGNTSRIIKFAQDITSFEIIQKDTLTSFFNRAKLLSDLNDDKRRALAVISINEFSSFNDFYGDEFCDELIVSFSKKLSNFFSSDFKLYKLYGANFVILNDMLNSNEFLSYIIDLNEEIKNTRLDLNFKNFNILTTTGVSFESNDVILKTAEISNKYARKESKDILVYSQTLNLEKEFENNLLWVEKIKSALRDDRIILHYQAIFDNTRNKITKYESLVRLIDTDGKIYYPNSFLDISKKSKLYIDITKEVIRKSFEEFKDKTYEFSINLTVEDILDKKLKVYLIELLKEYNIGDRLVIELVESERVTKYEPVYDFIDEIKQYGCKLAIDDFGSGYSNFEYLLQIEADYVKIDGSIIKKILTSESSLQIVKSIVLFSKSVGISIIAEFISDDDLFNKVKELGIDYSQGFYIGKPSSEL